MAARSAAPDRPSDRPHRPTARNALSAEGAIGWAKSRITRKHEITKHERTETRLDFSVPLLFFVAARQTVSFFFRLSFMLLRLFRSSFVYLFRSSFGSSLSRRWGFPIAV